MESHGQLEEEIKEIQEQFKHKMKQEDEKDQELLVKLQEKCNVVIDNFSHQIIALKNV